MRGNVIETVMGAVVLVVAALFLVFAYKTSQLRPVASGYEVMADFARIDGIHQGSDVRVSGVKVGSVVSETLDPKTFLAVIRMSIDPSIELPDDTVAQVTSSGLLGDKYLSLAPGGSDKTIPHGGKIRYTQSSISLENLIGQMMFSPSGKSGAEGGAPPQPEKPAQPGGGLAAPGGAPAPGGTAAPGAAAPAPAR
jgi:phospholipid/cholesterol/gamma-HCH transport system substrate-binding protein